MLGQAAKKDRSKAFPGAVDSVAQRPYRSLPRAARCTASGSYKRISATCTRANRCARRCTCCSSADRLSQDGRGLRAQPLRSAKAPAAPVPAAGAAEVPPRSGYAEASYQRDHLQCRPLRGSPCIQECHRAFSNGHRKDRYAALRGMPQECQSFPRDTSLGMPAAITGSRLSPRRPAQPPRPAEYAASERPPRSPRSRPACARRPRALSSTRNTGRARGQAARGIHQRCSISSSPPTGEYAAPPGSIGRRTHGARVRGLPQTGFRFYRNLKETILEEPAQRCEGRQLDAIPVSYFNRWRSGIPAARRRILLWNPSTAGLPWSRAAHAASAARSPNVFCAKARVSPSAAARRNRPRRAGDRASVPRNRHLRIPPM